MLLASVVVVLLALISSISRLLLVRMALQGTSPKDRAKVVRETANCLSWWHRPRPRRTPHEDD